MIADIEILNQNITKSFARISEGFIKANLIAIRNDALHIARIVEKEVGYHIRGEEFTSPIPQKVEPDTIKCKYCNYETQKGISGIKSHHGVKHKNELKQW